MTPLTLAVVAPTLNEAANLPSLLSSLSAQTRPADRVLLVDGGSTDDTVRIAESAAVEVIRDAPRGRGNQVAVAVDALREDVVFVAHADMTLSPASLQNILAWMERRPQCPGGCLGHRFAERGAKLWLVERGDAIRARWFGVSYGDQGQFFRRAAVQAAGGFPRQPLFEDLELSRMLRRLGSPCYLDEPATVSARALLKRGVFRTLLENARLRREYRRLGIAGTTRLYAAYYSRGTVTSPAAGPSPTDGRP